MSQAPEPDMQRSEASEAERFSDAAPPRIRRWLLVLAGLAVAPLVWFEGWRFGGGFVLGALVSIGSLHELEAAVGAFSQHAAQQDAGTGTALGMMRFVVRYAVVAAVGYGIFIFSRTALFGYIAGLFLPVAAMMCEAAHEAWFALRRKHEATGPRRSQIDADIAE